MKVKHVFPFVKGIFLNRESVLHINFERVDSYFKHLSQFTNNYEALNITQEYFFAMGFENSMYFQNENMWLPIIEFEDYDKISPKCFPAVCELVFNLYPYLIEKSIEVNKLKKSTEGRVELGRRWLRSLPLIKGIEVPLIDVNSTHERMFKHFNKIVTHKEFRKFQNALLYWRLSYEREDFIDSILDLTIAVESLFNISDEQSLKIPIFIFHFLDTNKHDSLMTIYTLYQFRNRIIHGNDLPDIKTEQRTEIINVVAKILYKVLQNERLPETKTLEQSVYELYHNNI
ncbi:MAG: hypothetical protein J0H29_18975 [Sphingobacteriales bacterium]|nr:hypothetical protein [Sphingobacteriales bacterium]OJY85802.1 MAG: hypothetical protein BGP14_17865 [Sphingobacteriales bacterium 44-15]